MFLQFTLNGELVDVNVSPHASLSQVLREHSDVISVYESCRSGICGQCIVLFNNQAVSACLIPAFAIKGATIETAEGLVAAEGFQDIERAFLKVGLIPCPHCAGTKIVLTENLLRNYAEVTPAIIHANLPKQWCSCSAIGDFILAMEEVYQARKLWRPHGKQN
jgi:carbon-monoxide dehydrogenase small subunit